MVRNVPPENHRALNKLRLYEEFIFISLRLEQEDAPHSVKQETSKQTVLIFLNGVCVNRLMVLFIS